MSRPSAAGGSRDPQSSEERARHVSGLADAARTLYDGASELLFPTRCVGCDLPGTLLCDECEASLTRIDPELACPFCGAPFGRDQCTECQEVQLRGGFCFTSARAYGSFDGTLARIVVVYKDRGERRLADRIAYLLAQAAGADWRSWADAVVFVPASAEAFLRRGFDHMELVAECLSRRLRLPLVDALLRVGPGADQRELSRDERRRNVSGTFLVPDEQLPSILGRNILLIDDVFTTGSTLDDAARALLGCGAGEIRVVVLARVW